MTKASHWIFSFISVVLWTHVVFGFYSQSGIEARVQFKHWIKTSSGDQKKIRQAILQQFVMAVGPLSKGQNATDTKKVAGLKGDHNIKILATRSQGDGFYTEYEYTGTVMVSYFFAGRLPIVLARDPYRIAKQAEIKTQEGEISVPCTRKDHEKQPQSFWYWWDPSRPGCQLKEGVHFDTVFADLRFLSPTSNTAPEYNRLFRGDVIDVVIFNGAATNSEGARPAFETRDPFVFGFREVHSELPERGFRLVKSWQVQDLKELCPRKSIQHPFTLEEYQKISGAVTTRVLLFWGSSRFDDGGEAFHCLFNHALNKASIIVYNGHSGAGSNLNLSVLRQVSGLPMKPNPDLYQLYVFNGCSSYNYYNLAYFREKQTSGKAGTKNLDIITNAIAGSSSNFGQMSLILIKAIDEFVTQFRLTHYRKLLESIDSNGLTAVNGDEDN